MKAKTTKHEGTEKKKKKKDKWLCTWLWVGKNSVSVTHLEK